MSPPAVHWLQTLHLHHPTPHVTPHVTPYSPTLLLTTESEGEDSDQKKTKCYNVTVLMLGSFDICL